MSGVVIWPPYNRPPSGRGPLTWRPRATLRLAGVAALAVALVTTGSTATASADDPDQPGGTPSALVPLDERDPDLKLPDGGTLAEPKVLDIKTVVEDLNGEERREDTNSDVTFALQAEVLFPKDSAKLSSHAHSRIDTIADEIDDQEATNVKVLGFTDNLGSSAHGDTLSKERADAVHQALKRKLSSKVRFEVRGYGERFPIADNVTEEGRKKNRRVEIEFPKNE